MRLTSVLQVRHLLAKLHPPLPKTPRESQQLLNLLETSFRKHLDEVHPAPQSGDLNTSSKVINTPPDPSHASASATNFYLDSILRHPLLSQSNADQASSSSLITRAVSRFEDALISGKVGLNVVDQCAREYLKGLKSGEVVDIDKRLGSRLATWFSSTNTDQKRGFLTNIRLLSDVLPVMYADGLEEVVWNWLRILYERDYGTPATDIPGSHRARSLEMLKTEDYFVSLMMKASIRRGLLEEAAHQFVQASEYRDKSGRARFIPEDHSTKLLFHPLSESWKRLSAAILYRRGKHGIPGPLFDTLTSYSVPFSYVPNIHKAFLLTYHPTNASPQLLLQTLKSKEFTEGFLRWHETLSKTFQKAFLMAIIDAANLFVEMNQPSQAQELLKFVEAHYSRFITPKFESSTVTRLASVQREIEPQLWTNFRLAVP